MYFLGIDGGGTKTEFLLVDEKGGLVSQKRSGTISYRQIGMTACIRLLKDIIHSMTEGLEDEVGICLAFPNWGESRANDAFFTKHLDEISSHPIWVVNDSAAGWAGSLALSPGINLVAGTGSIAYGRKEDGKWARSGGWSDAFSDEGSCFWLGKKTLELFSKESDGRAEKGSLFTLMREYFQLESDMDLIDIFENTLGNNRTKVADLQKILLKAAIEGDEAAKNLYQEAASELALIVSAVYDKLEFEGTVPVSYSGGLFHAGDLILHPFQEKLAGKKIRLQKPRFSPVQGAVLLAASHWGKTFSAAEDIIDNLDGQGE